MSWRYGPFCLECHIIFFISLSLFLLTKAKIKNGFIHEAIPGALLVRNNLSQGAWVAQSVKCLTSAWVMISWFVGSSPALGFVLTVQSLEPASDPVSPSLSAAPLLVLCLSLCLKNK